MESIKEILYKKDILVVPYQFEFSNNGHLSCIIYCIAISIQRTFNSFITQENKLVFLLFLDWSLVL